MDTLITIAIFIAIALISSWLKKKQEDQASPETWTDAETEAPPPLNRPPTEPSRRQVSWEEELRRLLEGESSTPPEAPPPPPVIEHPRRAPESPPSPPRRVTMPPSIPTRPILTAEPAVLRPVSIPTIAQSTLAQQRVSQIESRVAEQMRQAVAQISSHQPIQVAKVQSAEVVTARSMLRNRDLIRSAVIASIILGPPKALEENI